MPDSVDFEKANSEYRKDAHFDGQGAKGVFGHLRSRAESFWVNSTVGLIQLVDFWDTIATNSHVCREDISRLDERDVHLQDGAKLPCDLLLLGTGFQRTYPFLSPTQDVELGLHHPRQGTAAEAEWDRLYAEADERILARYPILTSPPNLEPKPVSMPFRLYNTIASLSDPTTAFIGCTSQANMFMATEVQALWTAAYLDGPIDLPSQEDMKKQIALDNAWSRMRYPWTGNRRRPSSSTSRLPGTRTD